MHRHSIALLGECTANIDLSLSTIGGLLPDTKNRSLRRSLQEYAEDQQLLRSHACKLLQQYGGFAKAPRPLQKGMIKLKNSTRMALRSDDSTIAYLVAEGCDLGVKDLSRSLNRHHSADSEALRLSQELIRCQEGLSARLRPFL